MKRLILVGKRLPPISQQSLSPVPDWKQCDPKFIRDSLKKAMARPAGGWYVVDAARAITDQPSFYQIAGKEFVAYRADGRIIIARHACPHLGGPLSGGHVENGRLVCPWHGLALPSHDHPHWQPMEIYNDGLLVWLQLNDEKTKTDKPIIAERPEHFIDAVIRHEAACEASDIIANRLDPWHGAWYHPHTFARLKVTEMTHDLLTLRVAYRVWGRICIEVNATFHSPEPRTIVMHIIDGEGVGSVVETHSTPIAPGRSAVVEATLATSDRPGFMHALRLARFIRPYMKRAARKLWVEDSAYAERAYRLRTSLQQETD